MGFLTSCWLSLCPHSQLPTHTELLQKCCIIKYSPFQGFHPLTVEGGKEKVPQQCRISLFPGACSKPELTEKQCRARQTMADGASNWRLPTLGPVEQPANICACTYSQPQLHALWVSECITHPTTVNHLLGRETNNQIIALS